jgi:hypothetical protein
VYSVLERSEYKIIFVVFPFSIHLLAVFSYTVIVASFKSMIIIVEMKLQVGPKDNYTPAVVMFQFVVGWLVGW